MNNRKLLKNLSEIPGPSGFESRIAKAIREAWLPYVDSISMDRIGSVVAVKRGRGVKNGQRLLLAAHMDEIGLMVKEIIATSENQMNQGFLRVTNVGGVDIRHLYGQMVVVHATGQGEPDLVGVLGSLPSSMLPEVKRDKPYGYDDLVVDVGLPEATLRERVFVGDFISFHQPLRKLMNKRVTGKALDNRASVTALAVCLEYLSGRRHDWDVITVATAQEETNLLGAFTSAFSQQPEIAIAVDVTFGRGPGANDAGTFELGGGPTVGLGPNVHPGIFKGLNDAANSLEMKVHTDLHSSYSGTDAFGLQIARQGIPTGLVGIPLRYMHTMVESVSITDIERAGRLIGEFVARLEDDFLSDLTAKMMED
jgi:endoglucanase